MKKSLLLALGMLAVCASVFAGGEKEAAATAGVKAAPETGKSIMINLPELVGFPEAGDPNPLPDYVREILRGNFAQYSGMRLIDSGDVPDYFLNGRLEKHPTGQFSISLTVIKVDDRGNSETLAVSKSYSEYSLPTLKFGNALNLATKDILSDPSLGVTLTASARKSLEKPLDSRYGEGMSALTTAQTAPESSIKREQNANIAEDLGQSLTKAGLDLSESMKERFTLPDFDAPAAFTPLAFKPPVIRTVSMSARVEGLQANLARYRENQAANKAAIENQQRDLIDQRESILDQWQNFLAEAGKRAQLIRGGGGQALANTGAARSRASGRGGVLPELSAFPNSL